jgi:AcrR family transcriptional regulator
MSRRLKRQEIKKSLIIDAAKRIFSEIGYENTTLEMIGDSVGLSKQTLYYYFPSKEDLVVEVCMSSQAIKPIESLRMNRKQGKSPRDLIAQYIIDSTLLFLNDFTVRLVVQYMSFASKAAKELVLEDLRSELDELGSIIKEGTKSGEFTVTNARIAAQLIQASVHGLAYHNRQLKHMSAAKVAGSYVEILLGGLCSPGSASTTRPDNELANSEGSNQ